MSVPEQLSLRDNPAVQVIAGTADLFLVGADGQRWPFTTVIAPMALAGPSGGDVDLVAVGRIGSQLAVADGDVDLSAWRESLRGLVDLPADSEALRAALTTFVATDDQARRQQQTASRIATGGFDDRLRQDTQLRLNQGIKHAGFVDASPERAASTPLVNVFSILGKAQGFEVKQPRNPRLLNANPAAAIAQASGIRMRPVELSDGWNKTTKTELLAFAGDNEPVALLPGRGGYRIQRAGELEPRKLTAEDVAALQPVAMQLYVPLPHSRPATMRDMARLASHGTGKLWTVIVLCAAAAAILAMATPALTSSVLGVLVPSGSSSAIVAVGIALAVVAISSGLLTMVQNFATSELTQLGQLRVESALWDRTLSLPLKFFRGYASGDLVTRLTVVDQLKALLSSQTVTAVLGAVFSIVNFALLITYSWQLAIVAFVIVAVTVFVIVRLGFTLRDLTNEQLTAQRGANSWIVQFITGIGKVRVAGAEDRFTALTMDINAQMIDAQSKQTVVMGRLQAFLGAIAAVAPMCFFIIIAQLMWSPDGATISSSTYIAFSTAFSTVLGAMVGLTAAIPAVAMITPTLDLIRPILDATQIESVDAQPLEVLHGKIELRNVDFQYQEATPLVLRNLSMTINEGELTAIVGPSGSGKTSTLRLITGVEAPDDGQVLIDGHDLRDIDGDDYRRKIGTVIQGGQLVPGSVLDNIAGGAQLTEDEAWEAATQASIADDIRAMQMGMHTRVTPATVSGGQVQRLLIARAFARKPQILLFDEATSALDNESQAAVMQAMASLRVTRVVVAHRLSTVMHADRILVVVGGELAEEGTYDSLMAADGVFAKLAKRQLAS